MGKATWCCLGLVEYGVLICISVIQAKPYPDSLTHLFPVHHLSTSENVRKPYGINRKVLTLFFSVIPFDLPENIRKSLVFRGIKRGHWEGKG